ncbi:uncharacterized protein cd34 [Eucyclogobius newberryi]|uniref:uncharacterized protein cd34 n=1 Tax=Eucyclogobius newberryi TaxID=166745 RepID=UPI003B58C6F2
MWRMDGLSTAFLLVLVCASLLTNEVKCQDDTTEAASVAPDAPADATGAPDTAADGSAPTPASDAADAEGAADAAGADSAQTAAPGDSSPFTLIHITAFPPVEGAAAEDAPAPVMPDVKCIGKEDITESKAVKASVTTADCTETKKILEAIPANLCSGQACQIKLYQDGSTVLLESEDVSSSSLASALQRTEMKHKLGVKDVKYTSGSSVLVGILVTGLLAAVALTVGYFKCQRRPSPKGERLAEEGTPVDQQNQANTLASDAPLNPPPETPEKPSANGEAPEGDKTQPPPTNGHSTPATTADTEL